MKFANKIGAIFTMVLGDNELANNSAKLKNMQSGEEIEINLDELVDKLLNLLTQTAFDSLTDSITN
jgi:histidyl-tRNA synthetase